MGWEQKLRGKYVCIEGPDGVGKTTIAKRLETYLASQGIPAILVREPGGTRLGEKVRQILLGDDALEDEEAKRVGETAGQEQSLRTQFYLFAAAREHLRQHVINPAKAEGKVVVSDRGAMSSHVYQALYVDEPHLLDHRADIQILLADEPDRIEARLAARGTAHNQFDNSLRKRQNFRERYHYAINHKAYRDAVRVYIDGDQESAFFAVLMALRTKVSD